MIVLTPPDENIFKRLARLLFARPYLEVFPDHSFLFSYRWMNGTIEGMTPLEDLPVPEILVTPPGCKIIEGVAK